MNILYQIKRPFHRLRKEVQKRRPLEPGLSHYLAGQRIAQAIQQKSPFFAGRLGYTESRCLDKMGAMGMIPAAIPQQLWEQSGVFPPTERQSREFADAYLGALGRVDLLGLLGTMDERRLLSLYGSNPLTCALENLEPYLGPEPWSQHLAGLRVLVVHPFAESIRGQYLKRRQLFTNPLVLPEFNLEVIKPPQTLLGHTDGLSSWSEGCKRLSEAISKREFDVSILGCGAYGLPASAFIKTDLGKIALYLGGATQILFGVSGKRWNERPRFRALMTPAWSPPAESERPERWEQFEGGCYW